MDETEIDWKDFAMRLLYLFHREESTWFEACWKEANIRLPFHRLPEIEAEWRAWMERNGIEY